jgi:hypothetical protein
VTADKVCKKCGRLLPIEAFRKSGHYMRAECKDCSRLLDRARKPNLGKVRTCKTCGIEKPIAQFPRSVGNYRVHRCRACENRRKLADYFRAAATPGYQQEKYKRLKRSRLEKRMKAVER